MTRIKKVKIQNFRSINDSGWINLKPDFNTLIGPNESGKTNFLKALESLNPHHIYNEEDLCSYNRRQLLRREDQIPIVSAELEGENISFEEADDPDNIEKIIVTKFFDSSYKVEFPGSEIEDMNIANEVGADIKKIRDRLEPKLTSVDSLFQIQNGITAVNIQEINPQGYYEIRDEILNRKNWDPESFVEKLEELKKSLEDLLSQVETSTGKDVLENVLEGLEEHIESTSYIFEEKSLSPFLENLPELYYTTDPPEIPDHFNLTLPGYSSRKEALSNIIHLSQLDLEDLQNSGRHGRKLLVEQASEELTQKLSRYWSQEDIRLEFDIDGNYLSLYLQDETRTEDRPSDRSEGFQWFLSFYLNYVKESSKSSNDSIFLLDDPGTKLHPSGKRDLLKMLQDISEQTQVLYSTHSPSLIPQTQLGKIRLLEKNENGTDIHSQIHDLDNTDALRPIRDALGLNLAQSLFANRKNILVEGFSDKVLLESVIDYIKKDTNYSIGIDLEKVNIINAGGAGKVEFVSKIIRSEGYQVVILLDDDPQGRNIKQKLLEDPDIPDQNIVLVNDPISGLESDSEIEDLIPIETYFDTVLDTTKETLDEPEINSLKNTEIKEDWIAKSIKDLFNEYTAFNNTEIVREFRNKLLENNIENEREKQALNNFKDLLQTIDNKLGNYN